ncbi:GNAT family N-acetyltransferase [Devosia sp.]|uniref:GNAT family N-acetyltransferase n=1 Tax=Devosia sp. TaxID=1871048 RepID=UPI003A93F58E
MTTDTPEIQTEEFNRRGRYFIPFEDGSEAELTYSRPNTNVIVADHTGVPPQHRNRNIALQLVLRAVEDARAGGYQIVPQCSYVEAQFRRHPEWQDLRG